MTRPTDPSIRATQPLSRSSREIWWDEPFAAQAESDPTTVELRRLTNLWRSTAPVPPPSGTPHGSVAAATASGPTRQRSTHEPTGNGLSNAPAPREIDIHGADLPEPSRMLDSRHPAFQNGLFFRATGGRETRLFNDHRWSPPIRDTGRFDARIPQINNRTWPYSVRDGTAAAAADYRFVHEGAAGATQW